ncbi:MAG: hypothetical protein LIP16_21030 [Clostridium sp.]|nr:hypothetical protein [Clostridium sp.]
MTFYDAEGTPRAYLDSDGEHIYFFDGTPAAYLFEDGVYGFEGAQYGWFERGWIRDLEGCCLLFTKEAVIGGPARPSMYQTPAKWARGARPFRKSRIAKCAKKPYKAVWSELTADEFFRQR